MTAADDGYSGSGFERPGFCKMMEDIRQQRINCIVVKDLSRFGRNYIEVGRYMEKFPAMGVRFIAVNDRYDNARETEDTEQIVVPFKNLINDAYCRDISLKVRSQLDAKRKNGKFIGSFASYGYRKDPQDKNRLLVDEYAAGIVRKIFRLKVDGYSATAIADALNCQHILPPQAYKNDCGLHYSCGFKSPAVPPKWHAQSILRILSNEVYTGVMVQGKHRKINYRLKQSCNVMPENWIRVKDTHEAIIPRLCFDRVQELMQLDTRTAPHADGVYALSGLVRCGHCRQNMVRRSVSQNGRSYHYLHCSSYRNGENCTSHIINEDTLTQHIIHSVQQTLSRLLEAEQRLAQQETPPQTPPVITSLENQISALIKSEQRYLDLRSRLKRDLADGIIDKAEYAEYDRWFGLQLSQAKQARAELEGRRDRLLSAGWQPRPWLDAFRRISAMERFGRREMVILIHHVLVFDKSHIEIHLNYEDEIAQRIEQAQLCHNDAAKTEGCL